MAAKPKALRAGLSEKTGITPKEREKRLGFILLLPTLLMLVVITLYPTLYSIWISLHNLVLTNPKSNPFIGLMNYYDLLKDRDIWISFGVTVVLVIGCVVIETVLGMVLALLFNRNFRGKNILFPIFLLPVMITPIVVGLQWRYLYNGEFGALAWLFRSIGVQNYSILTFSNTALPGVMVADIWEWTPFMFLLFLAGLNSLPVEPFEAARVDGASAWRQFWDLTLPLMRRVLLIGLLLRTMDTFKMFDIVYIMTQGGPGLATETIAMRIFRLCFKFFFMGKGAALSLIVLVIIVIISKQYIRIFQEKEPAAAVAEEEPGAA